MMIQKGKQPMFEQVMTQDSVFAILRPKESEGEDNLPRPTVCQGARGEYQSDSPAACGGG